MKLTAVSIRTAGLAYKNFTRVYPVRSGSGLYFWAFLGLEKPPFIDAKNWMLPAQAAQYVEMLAGPHFHAVAKAMEATGHQYKVPVNGRAGLPK